MNLYSSEIEQLNYLWSMVGRCRRAAAHWSLAGRPDYANFFRRQSLTEQRCIREICTRAQGRAA